LVSSCRNPGIALAAACAALFICLPGARAAEPAAKLAVLDLRKVIDRLDSWKDTLKQLAEVEGKARKELEVQEKEVRRIEGELRYFKPGSKEHEDRKKQLIGRMQALKLRARELQRGLEEQSEAALESARKVIVQAAADYAQAHGFDVVLDSRSVLYAARARDISLEVALEMNKRYKENQARQDAEPQEDR